MSEVFYRKWRPRRLDQVVGQEAVTQTLRNAVALGRVAHAYLFCGPRGTGKTSTARILAKAVNCLSPQDGEPDNECEICKSIDEARALDLIEIDAASNRGIDDIRNLRDKVHFTPNEARYKVYIVDEAHMLTEPAFNALLKTLEEPPEHAIFVLATTEAHKLPLTIISRCQRFDFRRIPLETATARLARLCVDEGIEAAAEALTLIARASAGSLRDAENLLEQALVSCGSPITEDHVREFLDMSSDERALELVGHVVAGTVGDGLTVINEVTNDGNDLRQFHRGVMEYLRAILLIKSGTEAPPGYPEETTARMKSLAEQGSLKHLVDVLKTFSTADIRRDSSSPLPLELALVESSLDADALAMPAESSTAHVGARTARAGSPESSTANVGARTVKAGPPESSTANVGARTVKAGPPESSTANVGARTVRAGPPESSTANVGARATRSPDALPQPPHVMEKPPEDSSPPPPADASPPNMPRGDLDKEPSEPLPGLEGQWNDILKSLSRYKGKRFNIGALLRDCREREVAEGEIVLKFSYRSHMERMEQELEDPKTRKVLQEAMAKALGGPYNIRVAVVDGQVNGPKQSASQRSHLVRAAQAMGARVVEEVEEKEEEERDEQEDDPAGPAASKGHVEDAGGA